MWIGNNISEKIKDEILKQGNIMMSAHVSEQNILHGMQENDVFADSINGYRFLPYPQGPLFTERYEWSDNSENVNVNPGYLNIKYLRMLTRTVVLKKEVRKWVKRNIYNPQTIFVYEMHTPYIKAALEAKRVNPAVKVCIIVTDLPQYMDLAMRPLKKILKKLDWLDMKRLLSRADKFVLYAKPIAEFLGLSDDKWTIMEGSFDSGILAETVDEKNTDIFPIMYSGVLDLRYGIPELLDAMNLLDDRYELWLTGIGNAVDLIKTRAENDERIKFFGYLPSRRDLINKQAQAAVLINSARKIEVGSKYCFPSKLFEYMASGNPVISCFLGGMPEEYHQYLIELESVTAENIAETIQAVSALSEEERKEFGEKAKNFVLENKNKKAQAKKILDFMKE